MIEWVIKYFRSNNLTRNSNIGRMNSDASFLKTERNAFVIALLQKGMKSNECILSEHRFITNKITVYNYDSDFGEFIRSELICRSYCFRVECSLLFSRYL